MNLSIAHDFNRSPRRICFVAQQAYSLLAHEPSVNHIGGAEVQQVLLARQLVRDGWSVSFIVHDHGQHDEVEFDGIRLIKSYAPKSGAPGLRFIHPRWTGLWRALRRADAEVYYQRCAEAETGQVAAWCRRHGRTFVFAAASNADFDPRLPNLSVLRERVLFRYGLRRANTIIAQTRGQQALLHESFGLSSVVLSSAVEMTSKPMADDESTPQRNGLLWVGRFAPVKRLEWCLELAERLPEQRFVIAGGGKLGGSMSNQALAAQARNLRNIDWLGFVPHAHMHSLYRRSAALLCTSVLEGFPNTFLEAWSSGTPVITSFDPDGLIATHGMGRVGSSVAELAAAIRELQPGSHAWRYCSKNALNYVRENHDPARIAGRLAEILSQAELAAK